jgi:hypothetical protein
MRVNINSLIKSCGTLTDPAAETKSIGLPADALVPSCPNDRSKYLKQKTLSSFGRAGFFARHLDYFIVTRNFIAIYRDLVSSRQITVTQNFSAVYRDWQKTRHPDTDANSLNRRAVIFKPLIACERDTSTSMA